MNPTVYRVKKALEVVAGLIAIERASRTVGSRPAWRLADEEDLRFETTVQFTEHGSLVREIRTDPASPSFMREDLEFSIKRYCHSII